jgi:hypothetical protein
VKAGQQAVEIFPGNESKTMLGSPLQTPTNSFQRIETLLKTNVLSEMSRSFRGMLFSQNLSFVAMKKGQALFVMSHDQNLFPQEF